MSKRAQMGSFGDLTRLSMRVLSSSAHGREQRASECKPDGTVPGKGTSTRAQSGKQVQARAAFSADRVASGSQSGATAGSKSFRWFSSLLVVGLLVLPASAHAKCRTHRCFQRVHQHRAQHWLREHRPWVYAWRHLTDWERTWARCIANHETRGIAWNRKRYVATGNGYFGATQWLPSTWHNAGGSGIPTDYTLHEQLVRTVRWAHVAGSSQWSTSQFCGSV